MSSDAATSKVAIVSTIFATPPIALWSVARAISATAGRTMSMASSARRSIRRTTRTNGPSSALENGLNVDPSTGNCVSRDLGIDSRCVPIDLFHGFGSPYARHVELRHRARLQGRLHPGTGGQRFDHWRSRRVGHPVTVVEEPGLDRARHRIPPGATATGYQPRLPDQRPVRTGLGDACRFRSPGST